MPYPTPSSQLRSYVSTFKDSNETSFEEDESVVDKGSGVGANRQRRLEEWACSKAKVKEEKKVRLLCFKYRGKVRLLDRLSSRSAAGDSSFPQ